MTLPPEVLRRSGRARSLVTVVPSRGVRVVVEERLAEPATLEPVAIADAVTFR